LLSCVSDAALQDTAPLRDIIIDGLEVRRGTLARGELAIQFLGARQFVASGRGEGLADTLIEAVRVVGQRLDPAGKV